MMFYKISKIRIIKKVLVLINNFNFKIGINIVSKLNYNIFVMTTG